MRARTYRAMQVMNCEQEILRGILLKVKYPLWHDADSIIRMSADKLAFFKKAWGAFYG